MRRGVLLSLVALLACSAGAPPPLPPPPAVAKPPVAAEPPPPDPCVAARAAVQKAPALLAEGKLDRAARSLRKAASKCAATATTGRASLGRALVRLGRAAEAKQVAAAIEGDPRAGEEARAAAAEVREQGAKLVEAGSKEGAQRLAEAREALAGATPEKVERARAILLGLGELRPAHAEVLLAAAEAVRVQGEPAVAQALTDRALGALESTGDAVEVDGAAEVGARRGHAVLSAAFSGDGLVFGAGYAGGVFRTFDAATGRPRQTHVQPWETRALAFRMEQGQYFARVATSARTGWSADGRLEVKAHDRTLFVRDGKNDQVCEGEGGGGDIQSVAVSPDGREAVTLSPREALLWDATHCAVIAPLPAVDGASPLAASYTPDGDAVGIAWSTGAVRLVTLATRRDREVASSAPSHDLHKLLFLSGGRAVAVADPLRVWDLESGAARPEVAPEGTALAVSPDGKLVVSTLGDDGALRFTDARTGRLRVALRALDEGDSAYAIAPGEAPGDTRVEPLDAAARDVLVCRAGPRAYPYALCAERAERSGLFAAAIRGEEL